MQSPPEPIEILNRRLIDYFGKTSEGNPIWRVVWSDTQIEKRSGTFSRFDMHGNRIGEDTGVREVPKYSYIKNRYVMERHCYIPDEVQTDLTEKFSYEPVWTFEDNHKNPVPPVWDALIIIIDTILKASAQVVGKYRETNESFNKKQAEEKARTMDYMFGNETKVGDALAYGDGISMANLDGKISKTVH